MCVCSQVVGSRAVGSVSVRLGEARAAAQAELDGFRTRALRAEEGSQRPSYVSEWRCVEASAPVVLQSVSVIALGGGGVFEKVVLVDAACRTYQQTLWDHEATALRYVGVMDTQEIKGCTSVVLSVLGKNV